MDDGKEVVEDLRSSTRDKLEDLVDEAIDKLAVAFLAASVILSGYKQCPSRWWMEQTSRA